MSKQEEVSKPKKGEAPAAEVKANPKTIERGKDIKKGIDELLDNIDDVLENNAEEFVKNYVQKGGQ